MAHYKYSDELKRRAAGMRRDGSSLKEIARALRMSVGAVSGAIEKFAPTLINRRGTYRTCGAGTRKMILMNEEDHFTYHWTPRKMAMPPLPFVDSGFIRPPTPAQLMVGHARMAGHR